MTVVLADLASKAVARHWLVRHEWHWEFFTLHVVHNTGASFSLWSGHGWGLVIVTASVTALVALWASRVAPGAPALAVGLLLGGGVGNTVDRVVAPGHGVTDVLALGSWFVCNLADVAVSASVAIGVVLTLRGKGWR